MICWWESLNLVLMATHLQQFVPPYSATVDVLAQLSAVLAAAYIQDFVDLNGLAADAGLHRV